MVPSKDKRSRPRLAFADKGVGPGGERCLTGIRLALFLRRGGPALQRNDGRRIWGVSRLVEQSGQERIEIGRRRQRVQCNPATNILLKQNLTVLRR